MKPLAIDLFCGLGGWAQGFLAEAYDVVGFDIERHDYGTGGYPGQLVLQDVLTLHGSQFKDAAVIVASPPCQEYSYMAMPWKRAKKIRRALQGQDAFPDGYTGSRTEQELTQLFNVCFCLQQEACEASGRHIPLIVENVRRAQPWVGRAKWHYGSYYLWGDVPALMPISLNAAKIEGTGSWFYAKDNPDAFCWRSNSFTPSGLKLPGNNSERRLEYRLRDAGTKQGGEWWHDNNGIRRYSSKSPKRKAASAEIAKIPFPLALHIARCFKPVTSVIL